MLWSSEGGGEKHVWGGSNPEGGGGYMDGIGGATPPGSLECIFMSRLRLAFVPTGFSLYSALRGTNGSARSTRGLFLDWASAAFEDGERCGSGELSVDNSSSAGRSMSSGTIASLPLPGRDGGGWRGGPHDLSAWKASNSVRRRSLSSCNRLACSSNLATSLACSSCLASISWR